MNNLLRNLGLALLAAALLPATAFAAGEITGQVAGYVYDPTGSALSEIPLTIRGSALLRPESRTSGDDGRFEFVGLPPGEDYVIEASVPGFAPIKQTGIHVRVGQTTPVDVHLEVLTETQAVATYTIVEKVNPVLNPDSAQAVSVVTAEKAAQTPIFHQVEGIPQQAPGVGPGNKPSTRGGLNRYGKFYVDGMDTTDVTDGSITAPMNFDAVEQFEVITGGLDAQYNALGMVENVVTKNGSNRFTYDVNLTLSPAWASSHDQVPSGQPSYVGRYTNNPAPYPQTLFYSPVLNVGGPIIKDRLWFYVSGQINYSDRETPITTAYSPFENRAVLTHTDLARGKLTWQATDHDRVSLGVNFDHNDIQNNVGSPSVTPDAEGKTNRGGYFIIGNYFHNFSDNVLFTLQTGMTNKRVDFDPVKDDGTVSHTDATAQVTQFSAGRVSFDQQGNFLHEAKQRYQFDPTLSLNLHGHQVKGGVQVSLLEDRQITGVTGNQRFLDRGGVCDPTNPATFTFCNQRIDYYDTAGNAAPLSTKASVLNTGVFLQDRWTVSRKLTLVPGFRVDVGKLYGDGGAFITNLVGFGPRLSATYDLFGDRKSLLVGHYGRSNDTGNIYIAQHANPALTQVSSSFSNGSFASCSPNPTGPTPGCTITGGASGRVFAKDPTPPHVDELFAGFHQEFFPETVLGLDLTYRRYSNEWADEELNRIYDPSGTKIVGYENGSAQSILRAESPGSAYREYKGADLWVEGTPGHWDVLASYTLSYNTGTVSDYFDGYLNNPRFTQFYDGSVPDDRRHQMKGAISYRTGFGLDLGLRVQYRTGSPMWVSFANPADGNQRVYRSPRGTGFANNAATGAPDFNDPSSVVELRNPSQFLLDVEARYNLGALLGLTATKVEVTGFVVNVLNNNDPVTLVDSYSARNNRFGQAVFRNSPLQAELILRVRN